MKKIIVSLVITTTLFSCDPNQDKKVGSQPLVLGSGSGSGSGNAAGSGTTDVPIDGGLSVLLIAGAAYGAKRFRNKKAKDAE